MFETCFGSQAIVRELNDLERKAFPTAEIVREADYLGGYWRAKALLTQHQEAKRRFPGHFIEVVGSSYKEGAYIPTYGASVFTVYLYSKIAPVPLEHAQFSSHMIKDPIKGISTCECSSCQAHLDFHTKHKLDLRANRLIDAYKEYNLKIETGDPSDYCLGPGGILFFEFDEFILPKQTLSKRSLVSALR